MEGLFFIALMSALGGSAFVYFRYRSDASRTRRVLRRARVQRIVDLKDGKLACIIGRVELETEQLTSMVAHRACVAYDTVVYFYNKQNVGYAERVEVERRLVPFFVDDGTGRIRVDAAEAALCNRPIAKSERFEERVIEVGSTIRIVGSVMLEPAHEHHADERLYRDAVGMKATLTGTTSYPVLIDVEHD